MLKLDANKQFFGVGYNLLSASCWAWAYCAVVTPSGLSA